jgi:hypothetical protein
LYFPAAADAVCICQVSFFIDAARFSRKQPLNKIIEITGPIEKKCIQREIHLNPIKMYMNDTNNSRNSNEQILLRHA